MDGGGEAQGLPRPPMSPFAQLSESKHPTGRRPRSLAPHIFGRVAFPVGIVFLSCFSLLDRLVQSQLRDHMQQELVSGDAQKHRASLNGDARLSRSLTALADAAGIPQALQRRKGTFPEQLRRLGESLDEDLYALFGPDKLPIVTLRRDAKALRRATRNLPLPEARRLAELD